MNTKCNEEIGLVKVEEWKICADPYHAPPSHMWVPLGHVWHHKCPSCGANSCIEGSKIICQHSFS